MIDYLVDTNVLIQWSSSLAARYSAARAALKRLRRDNHRLFVTPQNLIEFWNVATRPANKNGLGSSSLAAVRVLRMLERFFILLPDTPQIYPEWRRIVMEHQVLGAQVHDAHLVAAMRVHGVSRILTFNGKDFARYANEGIVAIAPNDDAILRRVRETEEQYQTDAEFKRAMDYVLEKNKELYQRLA